MNSILEKIVAARRRQIEKDRAILSDAELRASAEQAVVTRDFPFEKALRGPKIAIIAEIKKASPSKGLLSPNFPYVELARCYEAAGADAVSVLTEPEFFLGANRYLSEISHAVFLPIQADLAQRLHGERAGLIGHEGFVDIGKYTALALCAFADLGDVIATDDHIVGGRYHGLAILRF